MTVLLTRAARRAGPKPARASIVSEGTGTGGPRSSFPKLSLIVKAALSTSYSPSWKYPRATQRALEAARLTAGRSRRTDTATEALQTDPEAYALPRNAIQAS